METQVVARPRLRWSALAALGLLLSSAVPARDSEAAGPQLVFAAGEAEGHYHATARELRNRLSEAGVDLEVAETDGSVGNLDRLLATGEDRADFALVQQDVAADHFRQNPDSDLRVLDRPFFEYLHILVRSELHVDSAGDLGRLRTWPGAPNSGSRFTALRFLENVGIPRREIPGNETRSGGDEPAGNLKDMLTLFENDELDVAIQVTVAGGSKVICKGFEQRLFRLFSLDYRSLRLLLDTETELERSNAALDQLVVSNIPAHTYSGQSEAIQTLAVPVLLLARSGDVAEAVRVRDELRAISKRRSVPAGDGECVVADTGARGKPLSESRLPLHPDYEEPLTIGTVWTVVSWLLFAALLILVFAAWRWRGHWRIRWVSRWLGRRLILIFALGLAFSVLVITWATYWVEHERNENFSTPFESFWSITIFLVSGLEDREPYTAAGRMIATVGLLLGPTTFAVLTGWLAGTFIRWETRMPKNMKDHFLLLNWNERAQDIIRQLHHPVVTKRMGHASIVALTDDEGLVRHYKTQGHGEEDAFEDFLLSIGDPTHEKALLNANALDARTIIILAPDADESAGDQGSLRSIMALRKLARERNRHDLHVVVEILDFSNDSVIEEIARDFPGELERASGSQIRTFLLAQGALNQGVTFFYRDLLSVSDETNEVYVVPLPAGVAGRRFREYAAEIFSRESDEPLIPLGIQRTREGRKHYVPNPRSDDDVGLLREGDELVVLAYEPPRPGALPG